MLIRSQTNPPPAAPVSPQFASPFRRLPLLDAAWWPGVFAELPATPGLPRAADYVSAAPPHAARLNSCRPGHGTAPMPGGAVAGRPGRRRRSRGGRSGRVADSGPRQDTAVFLNACRSAAPTARRRGSVGRSVRVGAACRLSSGRHWPRSRTARLPTSCRHCCSAGYAV